jgi:HlyD family secretion protein
MKKTILFSLLGIALIAVLIWFGKKNRKTGVEYDTEKPFYTDIIRKTVATGKVIPLEEIEIKPRISGIVDHIYVEEGQQVTKGNLIATIRVVPNVQSLNSAQGNVRQAKLQLDNARIQYDRNKALFEKGAIPRQEFEQVELNFHNAEEQYQTALNNLQIIKKGISPGMKNTANTKIRAEISGTVLEIPVRVGSSVIESNTFSPGTTVAVIADMTKMIFEGKIDEADVNKLKKDTPIEIEIGAFPDKKFPARLTFIAPKGTEEQGAVQFKVKADLSLEEGYYVRAGYSANADIVLEKKDSVLAIREGLLRFDPKTDEPYVEIKTGEGSFKKTYVKTGISDGVNIQVLDSLSEGDEIKVWNKLSKNKKKKEKDNK